MNHSLKPWNTFGIERFAKTIVRAETEQQLLSAWQTAAAAGEPTLILGEGSNVLFLNDYAGTVILNRIMGIEVSETPEAWRLHVGAGENWHQLVQFTLQHAMPGLENLALIPGCAGSSPIRILAPTALSYSGFANMLTALSWKPGVSNVFQPRNAVLAIATVSSNMNIRTAMPSLRLAYR